MTRNSISLLLLWALLLTVPAAQESGRRMIKLTSQGSAVYQLEGSDVIGYYAGGVEFTYNNYVLQADELWLNNRTERARVEGNVTLTGEGLSIYCAKLELDGLAGELLIDSQISGFLPEAGLDFKAGHCTMHFAPEGRTSRLEDVRLELGGGIEVSGETLRKLTCRGLSFDGGTRRFVTDGEFVLAAHFSEQAADTDESTELPFQLHDAVIRGQQCSGLVTESGQVQVVEIRMPELVSQSVLLQGEHLMLTDSTVGPQQAFTTWEAELTGSPVYGNAELPQGTAEFEADQVELTGDNQGVQELALTETVRLDIDGSQLAAEMVVFQREAAGYWLSLPIGVQVRFDLAALSGMQPFVIPAELLEAE